jgi:GNAT superfamily N-acetyltransferase
VSTKIMRVIMETLGFPIIPGKETDIPELAEICKTSFPDSIRWQGLSKLAHWWWSFAISSPAADTYILRMDGYLMGFALLIKDENQFRNGLHNRPLIALRYLSALFCPRIALTALSENKKSLTAANNSTFSPIDSQFPRVWIELIAVTPDGRRKGIAGRLLRHCEERAASLEIRSIGLRVDAMNIAAIKLYEQSGYIMSYRTPHFINYSKLI